MPMDTPSATLALSQVLVLGADSAVQNHRII